MRLSNEIERAIRHLNADADKDDKIDDAQIAVL
jgi:hypothetical protein